jgi:hypothetical protein
MITSTYDPYLLISKGDEFGLVGMQTDNTLIIYDDAFKEKEESERSKANFTAKPIETLSSSNKLIFNSCILSKQGSNLLVMQKNQGEKLFPIDLAQSQQQIKEAYVQQRARGAYIASICQPEGAFDLSTAAQHQDPGTEEVKQLNKRLLWQKDNLNRGLTYIPLEIPQAKLFIFVDGSFANNKDLSSQIGSLIILGTEQPQEFEFTLKGNIVHWSSTKAKRVTRSVLASEILAMSDGVDKGYVIASTISQILKQLDLPPIPIIVCTDSYSLYECLVKLGTTKEKRLMVDIMALRESYENRDILEIRWINGLDNPADALTKKNPNNCLSTLITTNQLDIRVEGWVKRPKNIDTKTPS